MQMYVNYFTRELMNEGDNLPIGIVLCADKSEAVVRYTLPEGNTQIFTSSSIFPQRKNSVRSFNENTGLWMKPLKPSEGSRYENLGRLQSPCESTGKRRKRKHEQAVPRGKGLFAALSSEVCN